MSGSRGHRGCGFFDVHEAILMSLGFPALPNIQEDRITGPYEGAAAFHPVGGVYDLKDCVFDT